MIIEPLTIRDQFYKHIVELQQHICIALEKCDGGAKFMTDEWERQEGGGGVSKIISKGNVFEKGGVNVSAVHGSLPQQMRDTFGVAGNNFFACGLSIVIHPSNPYVPTVHANWRYFELYNDEGGIIDTWFGGGSDLTPYYIFEDDGSHFHRTLKEAMDPFGKELYPKYKEHCDQYFVNRHRNNEARGIGGVFYDYLRPIDLEDAQRLIDFQKANGRAFLSAYVPIVERRKSLPYSEREIEWQEIRRGRYAEFNLVHDRGTLFGLRTNGRIESILMSMPPRARWEYNHHPPQGSSEAKLLEYLKPRAWA